MLGRVQLQQVLGMISFDFKMCLTPGTQIKKFYLKFLSRNYRYCATIVQVVALLAHRQSYLLVYSALRHSSS